MVGDFILRRKGMTGNLRDHIAAVIAEAIPDNGTTTFLAVADAVIEELGLRPERGQRSKPDGPLWGSDNRYTVHRWVTEWRADDE